MKVTILILLLTLVNHAVSNTPYCMCDYPESSNLKGSNNLYTCSIRIDGILTNPNEVWPTHDSQSRKSHRNVQVLTVADRAKRFINIFTSAYCNKFRNLKIIDMSHVDIETVTPGALKNCKDLRILLFYQNKIQKIDGNILVNNLKLTDVHLSFNDFKSLPENLFFKQENLRTLELSFNFIKFLPSKIFYSQKNLESLKLDGNKLKSLKPNWFESLQNLKQLDLSYNEIEDLPEYVFNPLNNLQKLSLHNNKVKFINSASFGYHPYLSDVSLSNNELFGIDKKFIDEIPIKKLNMKGNTCSNKTIINKNEMDEKLQLCFEYFGFSINNLDLSTSTTTRKTTRRISTSTTTETITTTPKIKTTTTTRIVTKRPTKPTSSRRNKEVCGTRSAGIPLIIEGQNFNPGTYPWMAVLIDKNKDVHCGGVLISNRKVLTAGHCIHTKDMREFKRNNLTVVLGSHNLKKRFEVSRVVAKIEMIYTNPNWNPTTLKYDSDISVIVLKYEVEFNDRIWPICLPNKNKIVESITVGTVIGYGKTEDRSKKYSNIPKKAETPVHNFAFCVRKFPQLQKIAAGNTFCGGRADGTGACTGDSGGGLFVSHDNVFYLRGLVSASHSHADIECDVNKYAIYTNVTKFVKWINKIPVTQLSTRFGEEEDEEDEGNVLWDLSSTLSPASVNDTDVDYTEVVIPDSDEDYDVTTHEKGIVWSS